MPSRFALVKAFWRRLSEVAAGSLAWHPRWAEKVRSSGPVVLGRDPRPLLLAGRPVSSSACVAPKLG